MTRQDPLEIPQVQGQWATFTLGKEKFAVPVEDVQEVLMPQPLTPVPLAPAHIVGLLNLRGQIMPALDLRTLLKVTDRRTSNANSLFVLRNQGSVFCMVVDEIGDVLDLETAQWKAPPETLEKEFKAYVFGICLTADEVVLGLRVASLDNDATHT